MKRILVALWFTVLACRGFAGEDLEQIASDRGMVVFEQEVRGNHIFVYYVAWEVGDTGYAPQLFARDHVYGRCLILLVSDSNRKILLTAGTPGEIDNPVEIDYSKAAQGTIVFHDTTRDPRQPKQEFVRFLRTTIQIRDNGAIDQNDELVLEPEPYDEAKANELVELARRAVAEGNEKALFSAIGHLRNMGLNNPDEVLEKLKDVIPEDNAAWNEALGTYLGEVEWARNVHNRTK